MSVYRPAGQKVWVLDFLFKGQRIKESTGQTSKTKAREVHDNRKRDLRDGASGIKKQTQQPLLFNVAAKEFLEKQMEWADKTMEMAQNSLTHLSPIFGRQLLLDIEAKDIRAYQKKRLGEKASPRSINIEVALVRSIMGAGWARLKADKHDKVKFLKEPDTIGVQVSPEDEARLLRECSNSRSRALYPFVTLAVETGMRKNTIRTLQWGQIDFAKRTIRCGHDKTRAGSGRIVPLNQRAYEVVLIWAQAFPNRQPDHYVFPSERYGAAANGRPAPYQTDPTKPIKSIKESWEHAKKRAGVQCRFHDLKHSAVSRMLDAGESMAKIAEVVGWSPSTTVRMSIRYGHFNLESRRRAVEKITTSIQTPTEIHTDSEGEADDERPN